MTSAPYLLTSESVTEGHPDKVADQVSDAVLDAIYQRDPTGRVACETLVTTGLVVVAGEISTTCYVEIPKIVRRTIREAGYSDHQFGFESETCGVLTAIQEQSPDIAMGVEGGGAGDQGMMFGYATNETPEMLPVPIVLAHRLTRRLAQVRKERMVPYLGPDGKSQVTVEYRAGKPVRVAAVVLSAHHLPQVSMETLRADLQRLVIQEVIPDRLRDRDTAVFINPTGRFEVGGPLADTGLTGRKIIMDTYGGAGNHGGGAFSGKDPTKVDRTAAYYARYVAKNIIGAELADRVELQLAYAIGIADPVSIMVNTFGSGRVSEAALLTVLREEFDFTPRGMIQQLNLRRPIFKPTAAYGHFGRSEDTFTWERVDRREPLARIRLASPGRVAV